MPPAQFKPSLTVIAGVVDWRVPNGVYDVTGSVEEGLDVLAKYCNEVEYFDEKDVILSRHVPTFVTNKTLESFLYENRDRLEVIYE